MADRCQKEINFLSSDLNGASPLPETDLKLFIERSPVGLCLLFGHTIGWASPAFYHMTGYSPGSLDGHDARIFYPTPKEYKRVCRQLMADVNQMGSGTSDARLLRKNNTVFDCRFRAAWLDPANTSRGLLVAASDITEIQSAQIQKQQAQKMEAIGVLAGGVSHDFNNLLMGIQGHLSLMQININRPNKVANHIAQISNLVDTAKDLTGRLLGFARGGKYQISSLDINQVVSMALNIFEPTREKIVVKATLDSPLCPVAGDHSQLEQVLLQLMVNASQAMIDGGTLTVSTRTIQVDHTDNYHFEVTPGPYVEILVKDTGMGMDETLQKKIFDPFFSTKEPGDQKGRGLGLSTVFGIIKNHGGFITVESSPGEGASFRIFLPGTDTNICDGISAGDVPKRMPMGNESVLIADDDPQVLEVGKQFLEQLGYKPMMARNGLEAVELFKLYHNELALVMLDLIMPNMDGKDALHEMHRIDPEVKVLISTGFNADQEVKDLLNQGCHGFLQKPFSLETFSQTLRTMIECGEQKAQ